MSVLFADLVGFTALAEGRDPEDVRTLLTRYFELCKRVIARYGGTIEKFIGDAVMAVWGAPTAHEDDAERAVRAGLDVVASVQALGQEVGVSALSARAGIVTGRAAVNLRSRDQGLVAGDVVNTASRLQSVAPPGGVLVDDTTVRASRAAVAFEPAGPLMVKGKVEAVAAHRAVRVVAGMRGALRSSGLEAPFVGRDRELHLLKELFHASADERLARVVSVTGIAGIGKSRLSWEFDRYVDGLAGTVLWHRGRCLPYGDGVTYWALAEMVRMRLGAAENEAGDQVEAKLAATLLRYVPDEAERGWLRPRVGHLLGLSDGASFESVDLFAAWRLLFERLTDHAPVVCVIEDLQWADSGLLDFVEYLLDWSASRPLYIVTLARPELADRRPGWGASRRNFTSLYLGPLRDTAMDELLDGLVPGLPADVRAHIREQAAGVPLYAVETVRMLLDRGLLQREGDGLTFVGGLGSLEVPETLQALVGSRIDGLSPAERAVLNDAAVLGHSFTRDGLTAMCGGAGEHLNATLAALVRKEFLGVHADPMSPGRGQYTFLQELTRTVVYERLSRDERRVRHLRVAEHLEASWAGSGADVAEVVASHYLQAYRLAPSAPDSPAVKGKAARTLAGAGERAASLAAHDEAQRYLDAAAELADDPLEHAELLERAGTAAYMAGLLEQAEQRFERSIDLFHACQRQREAARVFGRLGGVMTITGRPDQAIATMEGALDVLADQEPGPEVAALTNKLASALYFTGDYDASGRRVEQALGIAERLRLVEAMIEGFNVKSFVLDAWGRHEEAHAVLKHALAVANDHGDLLSMVRTYNNLAATCSERDRLEEALGHYQQGLGLARKLGYRPPEVWLVVGMAEALMLLGRWDDAAREMVESEELVRGDAAGKAYRLRLLPMVIARGGLGEAEQMVAATEHFAHSVDEQLRACWATGAAVVANAQGDHATAWAVGAPAVDYPEGEHQSLPEAIEAAFGLGDLDSVDRLLTRIEGRPPGKRRPYLDAHAARFRARLAQLRGDPTDAEQRFKAAVGLFRELGTRFALAVTLLEHGELLLVGAHRPGDARPVLDEAEAIFTELGARPWLERLAALKVGGEHGR